MKYLVWILVAIGLVYFGLKLRGPSTPGASAVEPALRAYLSTGKGDCTVTHLSDISVGKYAEQFGGWPVYASHQETCTEGRSRTTYDGLDDARKGVAVAFARKASSGELELFVPDIFQQGQKEMQRALDKAAAEMGAQLDKAVK